MIYMRVAHHFATTRDINITMSYWVKNLHLPLETYITKSMHEFEWYQNGLLKWTEKTFKRIEKWQKHTCGRAAFLQTGC